MSKSKKRIVDGVYIDKPIDVALLTKQRNLLINEQISRNNTNKELCDGLINFLDCTLDIVEGKTFKRPTKYRFG